MSNHRQNDHPALREVIVGQGLNPDEPDQAADFLRVGWRRALECAQIATGPLYAAYGNDRTDAYAKGFCAGHEAMVNAMNILNRGALQHEPVDD